MKFSVIIPAFNEEYYLPKTLWSIKEAAKEIDFPMEIIVVDNESTDKTARIAADLGVIVEFEAEHNIAVIRNAGAKKASGEVLIFIDADTFVPKTLFRVIAEELIQNGKMFRQRGCCRIRRI
ncbi:MAG TPA: glycosyltransferase [Pyrinomonadaceae bacterium]|jgi:glycosyltransferase involved in cell wall biosynthesis